MNTDELTQIANVHQSVLTRHDQEIAGVRTLLNLTASQRRDDLNAISQILDRIAQRQEQSESRIDTINTTLDRVAQQQESNTQAIAQLQQTIAQLAAESQLSRQDINTLTANIENLRNHVADWMSQRNQ